MPIMVTIVSKKVSIPAIYCTKSCVASGDLVSVYSFKIGTNACENAPSAKIRRNKLGNLNATKKASVAMPAPNARAIIASRTKPNMRDTIVKLLTFANTLSRFIKPSLLAEIPSALRRHISMGKGIILSHLEHTERVLRGSVC